MDFVDCITAEDATPPTSVEVDSTVHHADNSVVTTTHPNTGVTTNHSMTVSATHNSLATNIAAPDPLLSCRSAYQSIISMLGVLESYESPIDLTSTDSMNKVNNTLLYIS